MNTLTEARDRLRKHDGLGPAKALAAATLALVVAGLGALALDRLDLALAAVLLAQAAMLALLVEMRRSVLQAQRRVQDRIDEASARTLADLSRARQAILSAMDEASRGRQE